MLRRNQRMEEGQVPVRTVVDLKESDGLMGKIQRTCGDTKEGKR